MPKILEDDQDKWNFSSSVIFLMLVILLTFYLKDHIKPDYHISPYDFTLLILATFRLVRLFTYDSVTGYIRRYLAKFENGPKKTLSNLINCPWCTGVWMSLITTSIYFVIPYSWVFILILALAGAGTFIQIIIWKIGLENNKK
jgi:hypothetical protein